MNNELVDDLFAVREKRRTSPDEHLRDAAGEDCASGSVGRPIPPFVDDSTLAEQKQRAGSLELRETLDDRRRSSDSL